MLAGVQRIGVPASHGAFLRRNWPPASSLQQHQQQRQRQPKQQQKQQEQERQKPKVSRTRHLRKHRHQSAISAASAHSNTHCLLASILTATMAAARFSAARAAIVGRVRMSRSSFRKTRLQQSSADHLRDTFHGEAVNAKLADWPSSLLVPPDDLQQEQVAQFCLSQHPFLEALRLVLREPPGQDLSQLHKTPLGEETLQQFSTTGAEPCIRRIPWIRRFASCRHEAPEVFANFLQVYHDLLRSFVMPRLGAKRLAFQARPTFRCHLPHTGASVRPHRDEDYMHPPCELNLWIPFTPTFGSNSLYAESRRGAGDFRPLELQPGQLARFYGSQVWHYTVANETDSTRVSIDVRVIREQEWSTAAFATDDFKLGGYYSVMTPEGVLPRHSVEMQKLREQFGANE
ncbi:unnamed protein product, partial [Polarella glacialis]